MKDGTMVGIRELRQNLSVYLRRVAEGETLHVTDRGRPVAVLAPLPEQESVVGRLERDGRLDRARIDLVDLGPPVDLPHAVPISEALAEQREE
jgi:prevent-host-death family protein